MGTVREREPLAPKRRPADPSGRREQKTAADSFAGLFEVGRNCEALAHASRAAFLVDGEAYFSAFMRAAERAERSILILAWDFDSRTGLSYGEDGKAQVTMGDFLNGLARKRRRLTIRILDWDYPVVFGTDREFPPLYGMSWRPHRRVQLRYDATSATGASHHQKIVVIDDRIAFVGGLDFTCRRWDTCAHRSDDARRTAGGEPYPPFHDAMMAVDGDAALAAAAVARARWRDATGKTVRAYATKSDPWPDELRPDVTDVNVAVACTHPNVVPAKAVRHAEALFLDVIARARDYIYIENQYFTSDAVGRALERRLSEPDGPEIVVVTRLLSHGWLEEVTMHVLRARLVRKLQAADRFGRFHIYYPHIDGLKEGTCIDVHSKIMVVDDAFLRIGSANLNNRSMGLDTECDLALEAQARPELVQKIRRFRDRLLAEHAGVSTEEAAAACDRHASLHEAIATLGNPGRRLKPLTELHDVPDAVADAISVTDPERPVALDQLVAEFAPEPDPAARAAPRRRGWIVAGGSLAVLLSFTLVWRYTPLAAWITVENITAWVDRFAENWWAPVLIVLAYTPASIVMFPRPLITLAAALAFGAALGFAYALLGILLAASLEFAVGQRLDRTTVRRIVGERLNRIADAVRRGGLPAMTAIRLVPVAPFIVVNIAAGAIRIRYWHFAAATALGMVPGALVATLLGDQLKNALDPTGGLNYWLIGGLAALVIGTVLVFRKRVMRVLGNGADPRRTAPAGRVGIVPTRP
jgi:phosphatidylserine/phosphatidylglycerophosphate/cardiolipin synthase-like enzyme/uncharacterized membrane protein YdjX (TVP38/TMEM64 family)